MSDVPACLTLWPPPEEDRVPFGARRGQTDDDDTNSFKTPRGGTRRGATSCSARRATSCSASSECRQRERGPGGQHKADDSITVARGFDTGGESPGRELLGRQKRGAASCSAQDVCMGRGSTGAAASRRGARATQPNLETRPMGIK